MEKKDRLFLYLSLRKGDSDRGLTKLKNDVLFEIFMVFELDGKLVKCKYIYSVLLIVIIIIINISELQMTRSRAELWDRIEDGHSIERGEIYMGY